MLCSFEITLFVISEYLIFRNYIFVISEYALFIYDRFLSKYDVDDLLYQEKEAILSRLFYVQEREECSFYRIP